MSGTTDAGRSRAARTVLALGLVSMLLLLASDQLRRHAVARELQLLRAVQEMRFSLALSHLWLEEYLSGDRVDLAVLDGEVERVSTLAETLGRSGEEVGEAAGWPRLAAHLVSEAATYHRLFLERRRGHASGAAVGIGSAMDVEYDRVFQDLLARTRELEAVLEERRRERQQRADLLFYAVVAGWTALVAAAAFVLQSREHRQRKVEAALGASQEQLFQAQKMESVGRLASGFAHDINNYLAAVRGHCELVRMKHPDDPRITSKMDAVIRIVEKASSLIERLLAFSRQQPVRPEVVSLNHIVLGVQSMMQRLIGEDIRLESKLAPELGSIEIDVPQLEQVLVNLVINARDAIVASRAGDDGRRHTITIETAPLPARGGAEERVALSVTDTGDGIPAAIRGQIFEPFFSTRGEDGHSGLGLATVHGIITRSGGSVEVESELGRGTAIRVLLPCCRQPLRTATEEPQSADGEAPPGGDERILVVDDSEDFRRSTRALLESLGYRVVSSDSAEGALSLVASEAFDLVITDVVLPGISGRELVERLSRSGPVTAIFTSGYTRREVEKHGLGVDRVPFLQKPFSVAQLARMVRQALGGDVTGPVDGAATDDSVERGRQE